MFYRIHKHIYIVHTHTLYIEKEKIYILCDCESSGTELKYRFPDERFSSFQIEESVSFSSRDS